MDKFNFLLKNKTNKIIILINEKVTYIQLSNISSFNFFDYEFQKI